ncbi:MAG: pyridoxal-dependent decarboxylase [Cytophagales bacterium]|nr:pyridoxal-dependent decarboxylase [Cytophagales bacterium]
MFDLSPEERQRVMLHTLQSLEDYYQNTRGRRVSPPLDIPRIQQHAQVDFGKDRSEEAAVDHVISGLEQFAVQTPHPSYYGLYNPRANFASILGDLIAATYNPQMAAWSHSPFAVEAETHLIKEFGKKFGLSEGSIDGVFTGGGAEANTTAVLCALNHAFPDFANEGVVNVDRRPLIYCSEEAHHSVIKAARSAGLGLKSVRNIPVNAHQEMVVIALKDQLISDIAAGHQPFMLIGTAGTTGTGELDPLPQLAEIAKAHDLWFHVDAAWGGAAILSESCHHLLEGIEEANSITFDAHKWLSVPMSGSMFITADPEILSKSFRTTTEYMPKDAGDLEIVDPFTHSIQWSRRFIGLKLYLSLLMYGWQEYEAVIKHQIKMGDALRKRLQQKGWKILNQTPLPVVCFSHQVFMEDREFVPWIAQAVVDSGKAWISRYPVDGKPALRACITNYDTQEEDLQALVDLLEKKRGDYDRMKNMGI